MSSHVGASNEKWRFPIWPEWNEADINAEKWDTGKVGKEKEKTGKSPISVSCVTHIYYFHFIFLYLYLIEYVSQLENNLLRNILIFNHIFSISLTSSLLN